MKNKETVGVSTELLAGALTKEMRPEVVKRALCAIYFAMCDAMEDGIGPDAVRNANNSLKNFALTSTQVGDLETADLCLFLAEASEEALG